MATPITRLGPAGTEAKMPDIIAAGTNIITDARVEGEGAYEQEHLWCGRIKRALAARV
jgi:hypothetical protein